MKTIAAIKLGDMKAANKEERGKVAVMDFPERPLGPTDVKVKVAYCSICGSDPHIVGGAFPDRIPPFGLGHEVSGVVAELGSEATIKGLKVGDSVAGNFLRFCGTCYYCNGGRQQFCTNAKDESVSPGMAEYVIWDESQIWKIPNDFDLAKGCLLEPVSVATRIVDKANMKIGSRVCIQGGGPIGLLTLQLMAMHGGTSLTMIEPIRQRRELALRFGADHVIDPKTADVVAECDKITGGLGYDVVVEVSGYAPAAGIPIEIAAKCGTVLYSAMFPTDYELPLNLYQKCYQRELTITGTMVSPYTFPRAVQLLQRMDLEPFVRNVYPIDNPEEAFAAHLSGRYPKILIKCNDI